jgi:hypothetical protein
MFVFRKSKREIGERKKARNSRSLSEIESVRQ